MPFFFLTDVDKWNNNECSVCTIYHPKISDWSTYSRQLDHLLSRNNYVLHLIYLSNKLCFTDLDL